MKITKKECFAQLSAILDEYFRDNRESENYITLSDFIRHEVELLNSKKSKSKPTPDQLFTDAITDAVYDALKALPVGSQGMRAGELLVLPALVEIAKAHNMPLNIQRVTAGLNRLQTQKCVQKTTIKKNAYFTAIAAE